MILVDANLLVYAHVGDMPHHQRAHAWLDEQLNGWAPVGLPWGSLLAFLRLVTNPRIMPQAQPMHSAWAQVEEWLNADVVWVPQPGERHAEILGNLLVQTHAYGNLVPDAHLAALAIEHGLTLYSADADFARFPQLRWVNPLTP